jgi:chemotaxis protein CheZ
MREHGTAELAKSGRRRDSSRGDAQFIASTVHTLLSRVREHLAVGELALLTEVEELALTVRNARAEISALGADDIGASHIPSATDELDAIVVHTATATNGILAACEQLDALAARISPEEGSLLQSELTKIYEACSFQDITGQRISKVVGTLKTIEIKVAGIMDVFAPDGASPLVARTPEIQASSLLNGPQMPIVAMDQSAIDALLASFD